MGDCVVDKLRKEKLPVTQDNYALFAYWKSFKELSAEEREDVKQAVYEANLQ